MGTHFYLLLDVEEEDEEQGKGDRSTMMGFGRESNMYNPIDNADRETSN